MRVELDVAIEMDDRVVLRADLFRPDDDAPVPVILAQGVYGKGLPVERFRQQLQAFATQVQGESGGADLADAAGTGSEEVADDDYRVWEVVDPSSRVPAGYACVRVDSRGAGASEGWLDPLSPREIQDYAAVIEWAGTQPWSNGKVGLAGKSYLAMTQWLVAAQQPGHLAAICVWHGESDFYRDATRHGGILYQFWERFWYPSLVLPVQHGAAAGTNPHSGHAVAGGRVLDDEARRAARVDLVAELRTHPLDDDWYADRSPELGHVTVPLLAAADWSDHDLHERGTIRGYLKASSDHKWLEVHDGGQFDDPDAVQLQRRFFDHVLKGEGDWDDQPPVQLSVRRPGSAASVRYASGWPLPETRWWRLHLDPAAGALRDAPPTASSSAAYPASGDGFVALSEPFREPTTLLGPVAATLVVSSTTTDADLFLVLDALDPDGAPVELRDHRGGLTPLSIGWLRVSHRELDATESEPWAPFQTHRNAQPLQPDEVVEVQVELRPTSIELPVGARLRLTVSGQGAAHDDPTDRPSEVFDGEVTLHAGPGRVSTLLLPVVPAGDDADAVADGVAGR